MAILVTGGAGYIGSVTVELLRKLGETVVVVDDLSRGHRGGVSPSVPFYHGAVGDRDLIVRIIRMHQIDACFHFAAFAYIGESVVEPRMYFENNVGQGMCLLDTLIRSGVKRFVFSSTCATYGIPYAVPISESHVQLPVNPYGWSKLFIERMLESYDSAYGLKFVALRFFNAAGATETHGEDHAPEPHLIPSVLRAATGYAPRLTIFGSDYPTPDGTAVRDYLHVVDIARAHLLSLRYLQDGQQSECINIGSGVGYSVLEIIRAAEGITGAHIPIELAARRAGDPPVLVADPDKARRLLGWRPLNSDLDSIIRSAIGWRTSHPAGYNDYVTPVQSATGRRVPLAQVMPSPTTI